MSSQFSVEWPWIENAGITIEPLKTETTGEREQELSR